MRARRRGVGRRHRPRGGLWAGTLVLVAAVALGASPGPAAAAVRSSAPLAPGFGCQDTLTHASGHRFSLTAVLGTVRVTYTGTLGHAPGLPMATGGTLAVAAGPRRLSLPGLTFVDGAGLLPTAGDDQLCVLRFGREALPELLLQPYTGGAHCCTLPVLYTYAARARGYRLTARATLTEAAQPAGRMPPYNPNGGLAPRLEQGHLVLVTNDGRFPYMFACFACSAAPILLMSDTGGRFTNVTRRYPAAIAADARTLWTAVTQDLASHTEILGVLPAWVADQCSLGRSAPAFAAVGRLERAGDLSAKLGPGFDGTGAAYVRNLRSFLTRAGYC